MIGKLFLLFDRMTGYYAKFVVIMAGLAILRTYQVQWYYVTGALALAILIAWIDWYFIMPKHMAITGKYLGVNHGTTDTVKTETDQRSLTEFYLIGIGCYKGII